SSAASGLFSTPVGGKVSNAITSGAEKWGEFEERNPDMAQSLTGIANIATLGLAKKGATMAVREAADVTGDITNLASRQFPEYTGAKLSRDIKNSYTKAVRPSVVVQKDAVQAKRYFAQAEDAIKTIIDNKANLNITDEFGDIVGGTPKNLRQFSEALDSTKKQIFTEYDTLAQQTGRTGVKLNLADITKELDVIMGNKGLTNDIKAYAQQVKDDLLEIGEFSPIEAQTRIQALNRKLNSVSDFSTVGPAYVDALVVNNLRKNLD
ncbi:unnamed protein product, partial [marine sediment metagenome]